MQLRRGDAGGAPASRERADFVGAHRVLTSAAGMAGQTESAAKNANGRVERRTRGRPLA
jgi:hypothetical protein